MAHIRFSSTASVGTWSIDFKYDEWPESSVRDRVCMTAALLVLEPIFAAADLRRKSTPTAPGETPSKRL
jgi:hypothetical protein